MVNRAGRTPIADASLPLSYNGETVVTATSDADGKFLVEMLPNGIYDMTVKAPGFLDAHVNVRIEGYVKDLIFVGIVIEQVVTEVDDSHFAEFDMDDSELFMQKGIFDKETAMSFRKNVLEMGGSDEPMDLYRRFRGADPDAGALLRGRGL